MTYRSPLSLDGRVAVVLGATSGLGRTIAVGLAQHGANIVASGRRLDLLEAVTQEVSDSGRRALAVAADVTSRESLAALRDRAVSEFGQVDILVNAAGQTFRKPTAEVTDEEWHRLFDINLNGMLKACQTFYPVLKENGRGRVVNIASLSSYVAFFEVAAYSASKSAVLSLTRSLGAEWAKDGVNVNAIAPGVFPTELNSELIRGTDRGRELLMRTPMGRFGNPEELIGAAVLLSSDAASFMTGTCVTVDGGYLSAGVGV